MACRDRPTLAATPLPPRVMSLHTANATPDDSIRSHLLELPAELRNQIYRLCLVSKRGIVVDAGFQPPPVLQVNHQIRTEAAQIFCRENTFQVLCPGYSCRYLLALVKSLKAWDPTARRQTFNLELDVVHQPLIWSNLLEWVKRWYDKEVPGMPVAAAGIHDKQRVMAAARAFSVVRPLYGKVKWEYAKQVLAAYKEAAEEQAAGAWTWS